MNRTSDDNLSRAVVAFNAKPTSSTEWRGTCPVCSHNCLILSKGDKQPVAAWCSRDCDKAAVNAALYNICEPVKNEPFTVERFCRLKKLPVAWVKYYFGVLNCIFTAKDGRVGKSPICCFHYFDDKELGGVKYRFSESSHKTAWMSYKRPMLYGLWTEKMFRDEGVNMDVVTLVEGESDTITLAYSGIFTLGISGAPHGWQDSFAKEPVLEKAKRILVVREPDEAGEKLVKKIAACFPAGKVWAVQLPTKDPSELWIQSAREEDFNAAWDKAVREAKLVGPAPATGDYTVTKMSSIVPKALTWLWPGRIPKGKITVFAGSPGVGKGLATCSLIAIATNGNQYPDEIIADHDPIDVLMMFCEDDAEDTVVPRLMAAGANLDRVLTLKATVVDSELTQSARELSFDTDVKLLRRFLSEHPSVQLVVVDPITSYLGKAKSNDEQEVRRVLMPLTDIANETGVTFILVAHFNKRSDVSALHKVMGAVAMTGVARAAWMFTENPDEEAPPGEYLMLQGKLNVGKKQRGLKYVIDSKQVLEAPAATTGVIVWGDATDVTADKVFSSVGALGDGGKIKRAEELVVELLGSGEKLARDMFDIARSRGIGERTLKDAKKNKGVIPEKRPDGWYWRLPAKVEEDGEANQMPF